MNQELEIKHTENKTKKIFGILWWVCIILIAILLFNVIGAKMQGKVPEIFGYSIIRIISGSMEDTIPQDSYILLKSVDPAEIKKGDIICFYSMDAVIKGLPNTHRVVEDPIVTESGFEYVTRGDANLANDKINATSEYLVGKYVLTLDLLSMFLSSLDSN